MKKLKLPQPKRKDADRTPQHHFSAAKLAYMAFLCVTMSLVFCQPAFAATDVWSKAKEIMQDVYTQIVAISTIAAIVTASVALLLMNFSRSGRTVDESRAWLKRICITWAILNGLGFTLTFNERQTVIQRRELCERLLEFLDTHFKNHPNLHVAVQYSTWYDTKKIERDARKMQYLLDGRRHTYGGKEGRFFLENGDLLFRPKYAKRTVYRVDRADILTICWELGLMPDSCSEDSHPTSAETDSATTLLPYEKYGSTHQIQLAVTSYVGGNLAIQMVAWEDGYPEPWASLTVNLDGKRQKDCAFIDTNGDPDFPVWIIRNGLAVPTGILQRSGFCEYPEYRFRADRLQELDPDGYASYLTSQQSGKSA